MPIDIELLDFGIVFGNPCFYAGGVKDSHTGFGRVIRLADWFSQVNKAGENILEFKKKILSKACNL